MPTSARPPSPPHSTDPIRTPDAPPRSERPQSIKAAQRLVIAQAVASLLCGFNPFYIFAYAFGFPIMALFSWVADDLGIGFLATLIIAPTCGITYAAVLHRWLGRADRRARPAVVVGTVVLLSLVATYPVVVGWRFVEIALVTGAPSLVLQAILLYLVFGPAGRRWFER